MQFAVQSPDGTVINQPPTLDSVTLTPEAPTASSVLSCAAEGYDDLEGGAPVYLYSWRVINEELDGATSSTLTDAFKKGDVVRCAVSSMTNLGCRVSCPFGCIPIDPSWNLLREAESGRPAKSDKETCP